MMKNKTKDQLADGLKKLMLSKPFEKITIKQICDETGVIRITFYNYFIDKYEAMDYIIYRDICLATFPYINEENFEKAILVLFYTIHQNLDFYHVLFHSAQAQQLEEYLMKNLTFMAQRILDAYPKNLDLPDNLSEQMLREFYAVVLIFAIKKHVFETPQMSPREMLEVYRKLIEVSSLLITIDKG